MTALVVGTTALMLQLGVREDELDAVYKELNYTVSAPSEAVHQIREAHSVVRNRRAEATLKRYSIE